MGLKKCLLKAIVKKNQFGEVMLRTEICADCVQLASIQCYDQYILYPYCMDISVQYVN